MRLKNSKLLLLFGIGIAPIAALGSSAFGRDVQSASEVLNWEFGGEAYTASIYEISTERLRFDEPTNAEAHYAWSAFNGLLPETAFTVRYYCKIDVLGDYQLGGCSTLKPRTADRTATQEFGERIFRQTRDLNPRLPDVPASTSKDRVYIAFDVPFDPTNAFIADLSTGPIVEHGAVLKGQKHLFRRFATVLSKYGDEGHFNGICKVLEDRSVACDLKSAKPLRIPSMIDDLNEQALFAKVRKRRSDGEPIEGTRFELDFTLQFERR